LNPNSPNLQPAGEQPAQPDYLAGAVLSGLARPMHGALSWSAIKTWVLGIVSFGFLPILAWQVRFRDYIAYEQQQYWHLVEWLRTKSRSAAAGELRGEAEKLRFRFDLRLLATLCVAFVGVVFFSQIWLFNRPLRALVDFTYGNYGYRYSQYWTRAPAGRMYVAWVVGLTAAYALHWVQVQLHARALRRFIERYNAVAQGEGLRPVTVEMPGVGLRLVWIIGAVACCFLHAFWGVAMMMAGAAQRRMVRQVSTATRAQLAHGLRGMVLARGDAGDAPLPVYLRRTCSNGLCRAGLKETAVYCPRCGTRAAPPVHSIA
jgi:hypothetical protein